MRHGESVTKPDYYYIIIIIIYMYPENPEGTQVIVGSMNMGYNYIRRLRSCSATATRLLDQRHLGNVNAAYIMHSVSVAKKMNASISLLRFSLLRKRQRIRIIILYSYCS